MKYAVIKIKGQQFKVKEGDEILVGKLNENEKPEPKVLLIKKEKDLKIGTPVIKDGKVTLKVIEKQEKGKKIHIETFKAKSRYRRKVGFRPVYSRLQVVKIS